MYTKAKAGGYINYIEELSEDQVISQDIEDELISKIDRDSLKEAFKKKESK